ncbi:MAG: anthranilate phosphoribosyltransferase [Deltaproteobacteria bacterium]|jgi:anthranilate phosphoribosyltransferase|nr:anthranilate phosphoribosyltransferase [Deltaproteobacteria bacterium]
MSNPLKASLLRVMERHDLTQDEMADAMETIMSGQATAAQIAGFLVALRAKGETVDEIIGAARVMRRHSQRIEVHLPENDVLLDTCGTGGDGASTFNISTTAAFVVAASGIKVAKHGNRSISSRSGSADVLEALGVRLTMTPEQVARCIQTIGIGFLFAPSLHPAMKYAAGPRRELGIRTIFNVLGPLTNPAGANVQLMGVYDRKLCMPLVRALAGLGARQAWVVHGPDGLDELGLSGPNHVAQWNGKDFMEFDFFCEEVGLDMADLNAIKGGDAKRNAEICREVLSGKKGPQRDIVALNAGAAIYLGGKAHELKQGIQMAQDVLDSGLAMKKLEELIAAGKE